ncbi:MAG TPA: bifunctional UDP-sugar hydrolase/5'-nucleotidase [Bacteroidales bacterium]|nr:bifunctional UDP-sugar hydrolase/5'-nucleotidase [Bacteroidales bacterium]
MTKSKFIFRTLLLSLLALVSCVSEEERRITILETTDMHGVIFPYDFIEDESLDASLSNASTYISDLRSKDSIILLDNGDNLQGQPAVYYYNFIDTASNHILAEAMNYLNYDAGTTGNHDFEAGHDVYDRLKKEYDFPLLSANAVDKSTGEPYFNAYTIIERNGIKVAILGMVTPLVPTWLPEELYSGIEFRSMVETAQKWMPVIKKEEPDIIIGLFHSGFNKEEFDENPASYRSEDGSTAVALNVPGFDVIFNGHDHRLANEKLVNIYGDTVLMLNAGSKVTNIAQAEIVIDKSGKKRIIGNLIDLDNYKPDKEFQVKFENQFKILTEYVDREIGVSKSTLTSREAYFGPSPFVDMIHKVQLDITGTQISFSAPLSFDVKISAGPIRVGDMFKLYKYENMLYVMELTGSEIRKYLEYSYSGWLNTMKSSNDLMLKLKVAKDGKPVLKNGKAWLINQPYNFDSAVGIEYVVDVTKPEGERVTILKLADGSVFKEDEKYKVAINSYRGSGGGGHLTEGAGLTPEDLNFRLINSTDKDLRYYILKYIEQKKVISAESYNNWKIVPEKWHDTAKKREYKLLFGREEL